ncbi:hypothetical protein [Aestuariivivens sp. NBU2969]|uniref:hypothetical protein n=1 Tax=Aestuariivivens sp. NBU2969 TaxID=2873267 RepID=UPI001CBCECBD|nr:hypothetical protein [Aestuariivivens sp. NBU2969]
MDNQKTNYVLLVNAGAMELYETSIEHLMLSSNYDFLVYPFTDWNEVINDLEEWEHYRIIDETTYKILHRNLCIKIRELLKYF